MALSAPFLLPVIRLGHGLVVFAAMGLFAWIAAHWIWRALEPPRVPAIVQHADADWSARILGSGAFGYSRVDPPRQATVAGDSCKLQPDQRVRAYVLRPEIIDSVLRERTGWGDLFRASAGGLVVQNPGGTGAMLGLYGNDVLSKADGAQLSTTDDVLR